MKYNHLIVEFKEKVAVITINRPQVLNALNEDVIKELDTLVDELNSNKEIRAVVITGGESNFAAGADITKMADGDPQWAKEFSFKNTVNKLEALDKPVIAAIAGFALGAGLEIALACDLRIAKADAKLALPEINIGIFPGAGGTQRLPRLIGVTRAKEMIYLGKRIDANTAYQYGLVNKVVEENVVEEAINLAQKIALMPPVAIKEVKKVIDNGLDMELKAGIEYEAIAWANLFSTDDQKEGMKAFLDKRKPEFKGK